MRNIPKPLDRISEIRQGRNHARLQGETKPVTVTYTKRDGSVSSTTGTVAYFNGRIGYDTGSVSIDDPNKGMRTINLHRISDIREA